MSKVKFTNTLRAEYENLFNSCIIRPERVDVVDVMVSKLLANRNRYQQVGEKTGIPWYFIAVIHNMEASLSFTRHLHNGDPLTGRTVQVPAGRPAKGNPPFSWEESAVDALSLRKLVSQTDWSLAGLLYQIEGYNGWGYRLYHPYVPSPYLWSFANHYKSGKYVADGTWSDTAVSKQCGAAVLLRRMAETGIIQFADQPVPEADIQPMVVRYASQKPTDSQVLKQAEDLQKWLNTFPGIFVKPDGWPGRRTSDAYHKITGAFLPGDPRL
jgi:lysozyme family protein